MGYFSRVACACLIGISTIGRASEPIMVFEDDKMLVSVYRLAGKAIDFSVRTKTIEIEKVAFRIVYQDGNRVVPITSDLEAYVHLSPIINDEVRHNLYIEIYNQYPPNHSIQIIEDKMIYGRTVQQIEEARLWKEQEQQKELEAKILADKIEQENRNKAYEADQKVIRSYPPRIRKAIGERKIVLGMTARQLQFSWGQPETVNSTVNAHGRSEQWVYEMGQYVYLDNGKIVSWQSSR